jgi:hypothetical protein
MGVLAASTPRAFLVKILDSTEPQGGSYAKPSYQFNVAFKHGCDCRSALPADVPDVFGCITARRSLERF